VSADFACVLVYVRLQVRECLFLCAPCVCAICVPITLTLSFLPFNLHSAAQVIRQKARLASVNGRCRQHLPHVARYLSPLSCPNLPSSTPLLMDTLAKPPSPTDAAAKMITILFSATIRNLRMRTIQEFSPAKKSKACFHKLSQKK